MSTTPLEPKKFPSVTAQSSNYTRSCKPTVHTEHIQNGWVVCLAREHCSIIIFPIVLKLKLWISCCSRALWTAVSPKSWVVSAKNIISEMCSRFSLVRLIQALNWILAWLQVFLYKCPLPPLRNISGVAVLFRFGHPPLGALTHHRHFVELLHQFYMY